MKKTFPININGNVFYIDEDAYQLLLDYLSQLRATFTGEEGDEIVNDIESRISEHFQERISLGANVIILEDVNRVIETMGRPEEISGDGDDQPRPADASAPDTEAGTDTPPDPHAKPAQTAARPRPRSTNGSTATSATKYSAASSPDSDNTWAGTSPSCASSQ